MHHMKYRDTPAYADDIANSARPVGSQLVFAAGILSVILIAVSAFEASTLSQDPYLYVGRPTENGGAFEGLSWLMCMSGEKPAS